MRKSIKAIDEARGMKLASSVRTRANTYLAKISKEYYKTVPLDVIFKRLAELDIIVVDEEGSDWQGFISGKEGRIRLDLVDRNTREEITNSMLILTWYKMPSGKYEVVTYLS